MHHLSPAKMFWIGMGFVAIGLAMYATVHSPVPAPAKESLIMQTGDWQRYTGFSVLTFSYPAQWHLTEYMRTEDAIGTGVVAAQFAPSTTGGVDANNNGSFSFDPKDDPNYIVVYREFMQQPECIYLTQQTSQTSENGTVVHNPEWPNAKCIETFGLDSPHYVGYAIFTPSKNPEVLKVFDQMILTFKQGTTK